MVAMLSLSSEAEINHLFSCGNVESYSTKSINVYSCSIKSIAAERQFSTLLQSGIISCEEKKFPFFWILL